MGCQHAALCALDVCNTVWHPRTALNISSLGPVLWRSRGCELVTWDHSLKYWKSLTVLSTSQYYFLQATWNHERYSREWQRLVSMLCRPCQYIYGYCTSWSRGGKQSSTWFRGQRKRCDQLETFACKPQRQYQNNNFHSGWGEGP